MALGAEQRPDAPTQASPSRPPDWSAVKQWKQHTRRRDSELRLVLCVSGVSVALRFGFWDLGFGIWDLGFGIYLNSNASCWGVFSGSPPPNAAVMWPPTMCRRLPTTPPANP